MFCSSLQAMWGSQSTSLGPSVRSPSPTDVGSHNSPPLGASVPTSVPPLYPTWDLTIHLHWGSTSSLTYRLVSSSDIIFNIPSPPLVDIICLDPIRIVIASNFIACLLEIGFHTLVRNVSFLSPTDVRSHNSPLFRLFH